MLSAEVKGAAARSLQTPGATPSAPPGSRIPAGWHRPRVGLGGEGQLEELNLLEQGHASWQVTRRTITPGRDQPRAMSTEPVLS